MPDEREANGAEDALRRLEARLSRASNAAERLIAEAANTVAGTSQRRPPPSGWQAPATEQPDDHSEGTGGASHADLELLAQLAYRLRDLVPPELQRRLAEALRELLLSVRALIDWYLDRLERRRPTPPEVTDIPIL